jgi:hypothetical protein
MIEFTGPVLIIVVDASGARVFVVAGPPCQGKS